MFELNKKKYFLENRQEINRLNNRFGEKKNYYDDICETVNMS